MNFSKKLHELRKKEGLSQEKLAELLNVSRQSVSKWETGQTYPELDKLIKLSDLFKVTLDDLVKEGEIEKNTKLELEDDDEEDKGESLMVGGFIIGTAIGFITENFMWGTMGAFIGLGIGYIIRGIKRKDEFLL